jgi:hypothetical protein
MAYRAPLVNAFIAAIAVFGSAVLVSIRRRYIAAIARFPSSWDSEVVFTVAVVGFGFLMPVAMMVLALFYLR